MTVIYNRTIFLLENSETVEKLEWIPLQQYSIELGKDDTTHFHYNLSYDMICSNFIDL